MQRRKMRYKHNYQHQGLWAWNDELFLDKLNQGADNECWLDHKFPPSPYGPLFGVRLHDLEGKTRRQMTQARRVQAMRHFGDIVGKQITHACGNSDCLNPQHFEIKPSRRKNNQG